MTNRSQAPTGFARRSRRLSDQETEKRMLHAAMAMVNRTGLTVSLDHLSFEDIIRDADVARSAVYRRWPYKDLFFSDLVKELAKSATPTGVVRKSSPNWPSTWTGSTLPSCARPWSLSCSVSSRSWTFKPCTGRPGGGPTSPCTPR